MQPIQSNVLDGQYYTSLFESSFYTCVRVVYQLYIVGALSIAHLKYDNEYFCIESSGRRHKARPVPVFLITTSGGVRISRGV